MHAFHKVGAVAAIALLGVALLPAVGGAQAAGVSSADLVRESQQAMVTASQQAAQQSKNGIRWDGKGLSPQQPVRVVVELSEQPLAKTPHSHWGAQRQRVQAQQRTFLQQAQQQHLILARHATLATVLNAVSVETRAADIDALKQLPGVSQVLPVREYTLPKPTPEQRTHPYDQGSAALVGAPAVWALQGGQGDNQLVAVVDTGIDYTHPDLGGTPDSSFPTAKVIGGHNWTNSGSGPNDVMDRTGHGTHVAGIIAADSSDPNGLKGLAPHAQLLAEKVFADPTPQDPNPSAFSDVIAQGVDDAVAQGAGVINMSLGSDAGFGNPDEVLNAATANAEAAGVDVAVAAGNADTGYTDLFGATPAANPDYGVVSDPSVTPAATSVAASQNSILTIAGKTLVVSGVTLPKKGIYVPGEGAPDPSTLGNTAYPVIDCGLGGTPADFPAAVKGAIALIQRGTYTFEQKVQNAIDAGAVAAIIYNNDPNGGTVSMALGAATQIPAVFLLQADGQAMADALRGGATVTAAFNGPFQSLEQANASADAMAAFSSWGPGPALQIKPELTAPGEYIYSTYPVAMGGYASLDGTSMATPHVAGAMADLRALHPSWSTQQLKNLLMNTSTVLEDSAGIPYPVREQGAGRLQLDAAAVATTALTNTEGVAKLELGQLQSGRSQIVHLQLTNLSGQAQRYTLNGALYTNTQQEGTETLHDTPLPASAISVTPRSVTVAAGQRATVSVWVKPPSSVEKHYIEGFVTATAADGRAVHVPLLGFAGDWNSLPVVDPPVDNPRSLTGLTGLYTDAGDGNLAGLGYGPDGRYAPNHVAFSPNGDGVFDDAVPLVFLLRNAASLTDSFSLGRLAVRTPEQQSWVPKNLASALVRSLQSWDGNTRYGKAWDGRYTWNLSVTPVPAVNTQRAAAQTTEIPVLVDTRPPSLQFYALASRGSTQLLLQAKDSGSGVWGTAIFVDGQNQQVPGSINAGTPEAPFWVLSRPSDLLQLQLSAGLHAVTAVALDYADNAAVAQVQMMGTGR